ncbi:hypothetical protein [Streptomyces sp. GbtcB6]|uniref:hypothetical protein n=1 Tax=Streptomyces sp. GbtcB6 TaxID=2824751 RepID=UPI001C2F4572|nr:hypothetical protein [Streptomyces sp. GbtcB6]
MSSRTQHGRRGAWRTTRSAALCHALVMLLTALVMCLGPAAHAAADLATAPMTAMPTAGTTPTHPTEHRVVKVTHPGNCPAGDVCCAQDAHGVRAVLPTTTQPAPAVLPRIPSLPGPAALACSLGLTPTRGAPDLHFLQVQRT